MSEELLVRHCSPTLAGIKTGSLFTCSFASIGQMRGAVRQLNRTLGHKGLRVLPLRYRKKRALIYIFRPEKLMRDLAQPAAVRLLVERGYSCGNTERCVAQLAERLQGSDEFPHEIGLFLGYPPEDVSGFIQNHAENCKCVGYWKVYGDAVYAQELFAQYRKCTAIYCEQWSKGASVEELTVTA